MSDTTPTNDLLREPWDPTEWGLVVAALIGGLVLRLWMLPLVVWPLGDAVHYLNQARFGPLQSTWSPVGETWWLPPLYPWLVSLALGGSSDAALTITRATQVNCVIGALLPLVLYLVTRSLLGRGPARWTLLLAAVDPFLVGYSATVISEPTYLLLLVIFWALCLRWAHGNETAALIAALVGAGLYWTRAFGVVLFPSACLAVWWIRRDTLGIKPCFRNHAASALVLFIALVGLTVARVGAETGHLAFDGKSRYQFIRLSAPDLTTETPDPNYEGQTTPDGLHYAPETPWFEPLEGKALITGNMRKYLLRQRRIWSSYLTAAIPPYSITLFSPILLLLVGAGIYLATQQPLPNGWRLWLAFGAAILVIQPLTFIEPRYFVALVPLTLPFAGLALGHLNDRLQRFLPVPGVLGALTVCLSLMVLWPLANWAREPQVQYNAPLAAAEAIRGAFEVPPERILDTAGSTAYYLDAVGLVTPDVGPDQLAAFARQQGAEALVLDERLARGKHNRPLLQFFYDQPQDYPEYGLWLIDWATKPEGRSWRAYRIGEPVGDSP